MSCKVVALKPQLKWKTRTLEVHRAIQFYHFPPALLSSLGAEEHTCKQVHLGSRTGQVQLRTTEEGTRGVVHMFMANNLEGLDWQRRNWRLLLQEKREKNENQKVMVSRQNTYFLEACIFQEGSLLLPHVSFAVGPRETTESRLNTGGQRLALGTQPGGQGFIPNFANNLRLLFLPPLSYKPVPYLRKECPHVCKNRTNGDLPWGYDNNYKRLILLTFPSESKSVLMLSQSMLFCFSQFMILYFFLLESLQTWHPFPCFLLSLGIECCYMSQQTFLLLMTK